MGTHPLNLKTVDYFRKTNALSMYEEFLTSQWNTLEKNAAIQWDQLKDLLEHAYHNVPYYYRVFNDLGIKPSQVNSYSDYRKIPLLTKDIVRTETESLIAGNAQKFQPRLKATGGSSGNPMRYLVDRRSHSALWAYIYRSWNTGGWKPGDKMVFLGGTSLFPSVKTFKKKIYGKLNNWLVLSAFDINDHTIRYWMKRIRKFKAKYMYAYPGAAYLFATYLLDNRITDIQFDSVFTTAEVLHLKYREHIEKAFQCEVFDTYGGCDGAGYGFECEEHAGLHIVTENCVMEIINEMGQPVLDGEEGEVVTTDLFNYAMPFIRYKVEDVGCFSSKPCPCGRGLPMLQNIQGRSSDFILTKDGSKVHDRYFGYLFRDGVPIQQYLVMQENMDGIKIYLKPAANIPHNHRLLQHVQRRVHEKFPDMNIEFVFTDRIPKSPNGKFKSVINKMA